MKAISPPLAGADCHRPSVCTSGVTAVPDTLPDEPVSANQ